MSKFCDNAETLMTSRWLDEELDGTVLWNLSARGLSITEEELETYKNGYRTGWLRALATLKVRGFLKKETR